MSLCFRCEHRAMFLETERRPRMECGDVAKSVSGCYMYRPPRPVVISPREGEERPIFIAPAFAGRAKFVCIADGEYVLKQQAGGFVPYFIPDGEYVDE